MNRDIYLNLDLNLYEKYQQLIDFLPPLSNFRNEASGTITSYRINQSQIENTERPALVFLHGFNGSSKSWACQFAHFTSQTVIAIDAPGFGESQSVDGGMVAIADEVAALIASLVTGKARYYWPFNGRYAGAGFGRNPSRHMPSDHSVLHA